MVDQVSEMLRSRILNGEIRPGTQLQEVPLAKSLDVSRNTVREAMRTLSAEGLVRYSVHRGVSVADLSAEDIAEIFRVRRMLELAAVEHASGRSENQYTALTDVIIAQKKAIAERDWPAHIGYDMTFHHLVVRFIGSNRLSQFHWNVLSELRLALAALDRTSRDLSHIPAEHQQILQHLAEGEQERARKLLGQHLGETEKRLIMTLQKRKAVQ